MKKIKVTAIKATCIIDTRGEKAIEVNLISPNHTAKASVPCGKSKGMFEAFCHPAETSVNLVEKITSKLISENFEDQVEFDRLLIGLDGTENKSNLGVNVTLSLSVAFCRLFAQEARLPVYSVLGQLAAVKITTFPRLFINLINGGLHAETSLKPLPFQEYLIIPKNTQPKEALNATTEFITILKKKLKETSRNVLYGDEGGFVLSETDPELGLKILKEVLGSFNTRKFGGLDLGIDAASSSLCEGNDEYKWNESCWTTKELSCLYEKFADKYPLLSIEDPFYQESWDAWAELNQKIGSKVWLVGDDLTVTNVKRIRKARDTGAINAILIKPNQIGTLSETIAAVKLARSYNWKIIVSHRSGETNDSFIADLAFGVGADGLKAGSPLQSERLVKYNRLVEIEQSLYKQQL